MAAPTTERPRRQEQEPAGTEITEMAPGILRSQLPISLPGLGHVNCYFLEDERGVAIVDPGLPGPQSWRALVASPEGRPATSRSTSTPWWSRTRTPTTSGAPGGSATPTARR